MLRWTIQSLLEDRGGLVAGALAVGAAFVLALFLEAVFAGEAEQIVAYPKRAGAGVWVMQEGVENMHMATSLLPDTTVEPALDVDGVAQVTPILYLNTMLGAGGEEWLTYAVGVDPAAPRGGPWAMTEGEPSPGRGEAVISEVLARRTGVGIGDTVTLGTRELEVVGLSAETWSMANTVTWLSPEDLADHMSVRGSVSYLLVEPEDGVDEAALARRIEDQVPRVSALSQAAFIDSDRQMAMQMGGSMIEMMTLVGTAIAGLVVAFTVLAGTARRSRELAVIKALGAPGWRLYGAVILQATLVTVAGYAVAAALALVGGPLVHRVVPEVTLLFTGEAFLRLGVGALVVACLAAIAPARHVARTDPATVFSA